MCNGQALWNQGNELSESQFSPQRQDQTLKMTRCILITGGKVKQTISKKE
jgi:hypothetical protein